MSDATAAGAGQAPHIPELVEGVPVGWCLGQNSWTAHRAFHRQTGRAMVFREYSRLLRARGAGAECLNKRLGVWRVTADQGETVIVQRTRHCIRQVLPADWTASSPPRPQPKAPTLAKLSPSSASAPPPAPPARAKLTPRDLRTRLGLPVTF